MTIHEYANLLSQVAKVPYGEALERAERILKHTDLQRAVEELGLGPDVFVTDARQTAEGQVEVSVAPAIVVKEQTRASMRAFVQAQLRMRANVALTELTRVRGPLSTPLALWVGNVVRCEERITGSAEHGVLREWCLL